MTKNKICLICKKEFLAEWKDKRYKDGLYPYCPECSARKNLISRHNHPETAKKWKEKNREKIRESNKKAYWRDIEKSREYGRNKFKKLMKNNPEKIRERNRVWGKTDKGVFKYYRRNARYRGLIFDISFDDFIRLIHAKCFYCGESFNKIGIDRIDSSLGYIKGNVVSCCFPCNKMKMTQNINDFISRCHRISNNHKKDFPLPGEYEELLAP